MITTVALITQYIALIVISRCLWKKTKLLVEAEKREDEYIAEISRQRETIHTLITPPK